MLHSRIRSEIVQELSKIYAFRHTPRAVRMASKLLQLPAELLTVIVTYIVRPTDLKRLCCTNQLLSSIATKQLYHTIELDTSELTHPDGKGLLLSSNKGYEHVRCLRMARKNPSAGAAQMKVARDIFRAVLRFIPRDTLTTLL